MTYFNNYVSFTAPGRPISSDGTNWFQLTERTHFYHPRADGYCQHRKSILQTSPTSLILLPGDLGPPNRHWINPTEPTPCGD